MEGKKVLFSTLCTTPVDHFILTLRMTDTWRDRHGQLSSVTFASFLSSSYGTHGETWLLFLFIYLSFYFCSPIFLGGGCCLSCVARNRNNFPFFFLSLAVVTQVFLRHVVLLLSFIYFLMRSSAVCLGWWIIAMSSRTFQHWIWWTYRSSIK